MPEVELKLYNTMTKAKEAFQPLDPSNVRMYVCGPTVYDYAHIGNARPMIVFDVLFRLLRHVYGESAVTYARNVTDVDDKINQRAFDRWTRKRPLLDEMRDLTEGTTAQFNADLKALNVLEPTHTPRATDFVANGEQPTDMVRIIEKLIARGVAYEAEGHVLFSPSSMDKLPGAPKYGSLSKRNLDDMLAGARVDVAPYKRDPMDFVLWKPSDPETEPGWESPWGFGRPGWHIECSAMAGALLGRTFDIHGGGIDLVFPHHENEIAQSCCAFGVDKMASIWMHNGFLQVEGRKMSKSEGNFVTINELLRTKRFGGRRWSGEVLRLAMLKTHYRQPIDWTMRALEEAEATLKSWRVLLAGDQPTHLSASFVRALSDDLNTAEAIATIYQLVPAVQKGEVAAIGEMAAGLELLGFDFFRAKMTDYEQAFASPIDHATGPGELRLLGGRLMKEVRKILSEQDAHPVVLAQKLGPIRFADDTLSIELVLERWSELTLINSLITARLEARRAKNFAESDRIRDELAAMGIALKDGKDPVTGEPTTTWEVKR
jgi:cysteinyl-tRNA synthetase